MATIKRVVARAAGSLAHIPMVGKALWQEFFDNVDWPAAAAIAMVLVALLTAPLLLVQRLMERQPEGEA